MLYNFCSYLYATPTCSIAVCSWKSFFPPVNLGNHFKRINWTPKHPIEENENAKISLFKSLVFARGTSFLCTYKILAPTQTVLAFSASLPSNLDDNQRQLQNFFLRVIVKENLLINRETNVISLKNTTQSSQQECWKPEPPICSYNLICWTGLANHPDR